MEITSKAMVSISDMIKNFKDCRDKSEKLGKLFILKNNQLDSVLFSINEYKKISSLLAYMETIEEIDVAKVLKVLPKDRKKKTYTINYSNIDEKILISIDEVL